MRFCRIVPNARSVNPFEAHGRAGPAVYQTTLSFRHTFAALSEGWGLGELELQRWLRHASPATQKSYRKQGDFEAIGATARKIAY